jgi:hypothetical protein
MERCMYHFEILVVGHINPIIKMHAKMQKN